MRIWTTRRRRRGGYEISWRSRRDVYQRHFVPDETSRFESGAPLSFGDWHDPDEVACHAWMVVYDHVPCFRLLWKRSGMELVVRPTARHPLVLP